LIPLFASRGKNAVKSFLSPCSPVKEFQYWDNKLFDPGIPTSIQSQTSTPDLKVRVTTGGFHMAAGGAAGSFGSSLAAAGETGKPKTGN
jgi:hypothetical protein